MKYWFILWHEPWKHYAKKPDTQKATSCMILFTWNTQTCKSTDRKEGNGWGREWEMETDCWRRWVSLRDNEKALQLVVMEAQFFKTYYKPPNSTLTEELIVFLKKSLCLFGCAALSCSTRDLPSSLRHEGSLSCSLWVPSFSTWDLVPWSGVTSGPPASGAGRLGHWTTTEVPKNEF